MHANPSLMNALALVVGYARANSPEFEPAAVRGSTLPLEHATLDSLTSISPPAALASLGWRHDSAEKTLLRLLEQEKGG